MLRKADTARKFKPKCWAKRVFREVVLAKERAMSKQKSQCRDGYVKRMSRTPKEDTVQRYHY